MLGSWTLAQTSKAQTDEESAIIEFAKDEFSTKYLEGDDVVIHIDSTVVTEGEQVTVSCVSGCPEPGISYTHTFTQEEANPGPGEDTEVVFAGKGDFPEASRDGQPRWNATWEVSIDEDSRTFQVYVADVYRMPTRNYEPTELATLQASGYPKFTLVNFTVYHAPIDGERTQVFTEEESTGNSRIAQVKWSIPPSLASHLDCPELKPGKCRQFEVEVAASKGDKGVETAGFSVDPAEIVLNATQSAYDQPVNRTEEANAQLVLQYEGSVLQDGVQPVTLAALPGHGDTNQIKAQLQRLPDNTCDPGSDPENVTVVSANWTLGGYLGSYTPPRDFDLDTGGSKDKFRWAVPKQEDSHGNVIPSQVLECFDINPYKMTPTPVDTPEAIERKRRETFLMNFSYANGATLDEGDNATQMRGVLFSTENVTDPCEVSEATDDEDDSVASMVGEPVGHGIWRWSHKFPRDFPELGSWAFKFCGDPITDDQNPQPGTQDKWGNKIKQNTTEAFPLEVASPLVSITTSVDGFARNATEGFDRGDKVNLRVKTTYPDGEPIDSSDLNVSYDGNLPVFIHRKDESGATTQVTELHLDELNPDAGTWRGSFKVPEVSAGAPLGTWEIQVKVKDDVNQPPDTPNKNFTRFPRKVHPDVLHVSTEDPPVDEVKAGNPVSWAFVVRDGDGDLVTDERTGDKESGTITVDVRRWDNGKPGAYVARGLTPNYDPGESAWVIRWRPPRDLDPGMYLFAPNGTDIHGNVVADRARSQPFEVDIEHVTRGTIIDPPLSVERGENVSVIFDGREGDVGRNGSVNPTIRLERLTEDGFWVVEEENLYVRNRTGAGDHMAAWSTKTSTPAGTYRFHMVGRTPEHRIIDATSETFEVKPRNVTRPVLEPLVPFATKGSTVTAVVGHKPFDSLTISDIRISGPQNITDAPGERDLEVTEDNWTVSWTIPVTLPKGEYVMHLEGKDRFGNDISVSLGPVTAGPVNLTVEPLRLPTPQVPRTTKAELVFRVTYPDESLMREAHGRPDVVVYKGDTPLKQVNVTFDGVNWHATYVPPADAERTTYHFRVRGQDRATNIILPYQSRSFKVTTGTIQRDVRTGPGVEAFRLDTVKVQVEADADDRFVEFELAHYSRNPDNVGGAQPPEPEFTGKLSHEWRPSLGVYEVNWEPPRDQTLGWYVIRMKGEDAQGNTLTASTQPFNLKPDQLQVTWRNRIDSVEPGKTETYGLAITYANGEPMTAEDGKPEVFVQLNGRPVEPRPDLRYNPQKEIWQVRWTFPANVPPGSYSLSVRGTDAYGNEIPTTQTTPLQYEPGAINQLTGATVPGPGAVLAALAAAATALGLGRVSSRR